MPRRVWCYDPGGTTGYAQFDLDERGWFTLVVYGKFPGDAMLDAQIQEGDLVVCERVRVFSGKMNQAGVKVMGAIELLCRTRGAELVYQQPSRMSGPRLWARERLAVVKELGGEHAADAVAHGTAYAGLRRVRWPWGDGGNDGRLDEEQPPRAAVDGARGD